MSSPMKQTPWTNEVCQRDLCFVLGLHVHSLVGIITNQLTNESSCMYHDTFFLLMAESSSSSLGETAVHVHQVRSIDLHSTF